jgi:redox-sensitive bicupin YhaK (pirin superfamily)
VITLRRATEREHDRRRKYEVWRTFPHEDRGSGLDSGFGALQGLNESHLEPGGRVPDRSRHDAQVITYVREGTVACEDPAGRSCRIHAGEFQQMTVGRGAHPAGMNTSRVDSARVFQIWLHASQGDRDPSAEQKRFSAAQRRGVLCVIASPDGRKGSLRVRQDVLMHSALLEPGVHVVHELSRGRRAWLHLVEGEASLGDIVLGTGDGAGVTTDRAVSITAREATEILLLDLCEPPTRTLAEE